MNTNNQRRLANDFTRTICRIRVGRTFTVQSLSKQIRFDDPEIHGRQDYSEHLRTAVEVGLIEPVWCAFDTYRIARRKRSKHAYYELMHKILSALGDEDSQQRLHDYYHRREDENRAGGGSNV